MKRILLTLTALLSATALHAQTPPPPAPAAATPAPAAAAGAANATPGATAEPKLVFDREVFTYPGGGRRDPFKPLVGKESAGPLFDDLKLRGIIYSSDPARSLVLVQDAAKKLYRLHRGDVVGNSRVTRIAPLAVSFAVENFGMIRNQVLELRPGAADAEGLPQSSSLVPATAPVNINDGTYNGVDFKKMDKVTAKRMLDSLAAERHKAAGKK